ncbi:MAG TPA: AAA family ATPase [Gaiellaceae bacterium]|nr:AAA family ATPase [Gaiellaceae bacterium]
MHLSAIKLRGFKSFPDPVEVRLEPGVAVVVGPNGSGKSNVADGIVWAAGSLTPSELRAEKTDDVLFAGGGGRGQSDYAEVELHFDNTDGDGPLDYSELAITRRLHRGGEGQYLVNRVPVRRIDLVEILSDLGLGGGMHSIIGQGKVEAILGSKPEERRAMIEEAAGLGRFKRRRHRAELKLARVAVQVERARDLEAEVRGRLRPLALQATAAERAEKLAGEIAGLRVRIALLDLEAIEARLEEGTGRAVDAALVRRAAEEKLEALLAERGRAEQELADAAGGRESASAALYRLRTAGERVAMRRESVGGLTEALRAQSAPLEPHEGPSPAELERAARATAETARAAGAERDVLAERLQLAVERLAALERSLAEREGIPPAARAFAEEGARLALGELDVEPGLERAVAAALGRRASALLASDPAAGLELIERARAAGLGSLVVVTSTSEPLEGFTLVEPEELLKATGPAVTRDGVGYDPARGELWFAGETAEAVQLELAARRDALAAEIAELSTQAARAEAAAEETATLARAAAATLDALGPARRAHRADPAVVARILALAERLDAALAAATGTAARFEAPLQTRVDAGAARTGELGSELRRLGAAEVELRHASSEAAQAASAIDVELARLGAEADEVRRRLESEPNADEYKDPVGDETREELAAKLERLERRHEALGRVNPLAKEEYEAEKARLEELAVQREDLEASLNELEELRADLTRTVENRFAETFTAVQAHFEEVASTLFPGGQGHLRATEPVEGDEESAEPGIEIELRPAGKKVTRLSLLSGGEKSLGAISFLFALFLARPCPFYLLDEVEAALDDTNIGRFVELLRRYADRAQFIVITHQKRTMEAADILYGVTMGADGISQIVSRRLPREEAEAVSAA